MHQHRFNLQGFRKTVISLLTAKGVSKEVISKLDIAGAYYDNLSPTEALDSLLLDAQALSEIKH
jgi:hypothetical protein